MNTLQQHALDVRARLRNPTNAVPDLGIDLKRAKSDPVVEPLPVDESQQDKLVRLAARIKELNDELSELHDQYSKTSGKMRPHVRPIQDLVCGFYQVSHTDLISQRRDARLVLARHVSMHLAKTLSLRSLPEIGRMFGSRDHTTVLHATRKIASQLVTDQQLAGEVETLTAMILGRTVASVPTNEAQHATPRRQHRIRTR